MNRLLRRTSLAFALLLGFAGAAMASVNIISFASSATIVASTGLSPATTQTSEVQFGSWNIGSTCRGPVVINFYNNATPTFGSTALIWSVVLGSPFANAANPMAYNMPSTGNMIVAITGLTALTYIAQSLNSEACTVYVATT